MYSQYGVAGGKMKPLVPEIHMQAPSTTVASDGHSVTGLGVGVGVGFGVGTGVGGVGEGGDGAHWELLQVSSVQVTYLGNSELCVAPHPWTTGEFVHLSPW